MKLAVDATLNKVRIYRMFPTDLKLGSRNILGLGIDGLFIIQRVEKLVFFIEERNGKSLSSPLIRANYEWVFLHIGIGGAELFSLDYKIYNKFLPRVWIKSL